MYTEAKRKEIDTKRFYRLIDGWISLGDKPAYGVIVMHWPHWSEPYDTVSATLILRLASGARLVITDQCGANTQSKRLEKIARRIELWYGINVE